MGLTFLGDKELVELLFFDANLTYPEFTGHDK